MMAGSVSGTSWCSALQCSTSLLLLLVCASSIAEKSLKDQTKFITVDIKPGTGVQRVQHSWDNFVCEFEYEANTGQDEQWKIEIDRMKKGSEWLCRVEPSTDDSSSLVYKKFKLSVTGAHVKKVTLESEPDVLLEISEYFARKDSVGSTDGFKSKLTKVQVECVNKYRAPTREL